MKCVIAAETTERKRYYLWIRDDVREVHAYGDLYPRTHVLTQSFTQVRDQASLFDAKSARHMMRGIYNDNVLYAKGAKAPWIRTLSIETVDDPLKLNFIRRESFKKAKEVILSLFKTFNRDELQDVVDDLYSEYLYVFPED